MKDYGTFEYNPESLEMSPELAAAQDIMPMSPEDRQRLKEDIKLNGMRHPIICYNAGAVKLILAGWNRREIAIELKMEKVPIQIVEEEKKGKEYQNFVISENLARRHLTPPQKIALANYLLEVNPKQSARTLAKKAGISPTTASDIKKKSGVQFGHVEGKDGKKYKVNPKPPKLTSQEGAGATKKGNGNIIHAENKPLSVNDLINGIHNLSDEDQQAFLIKFIRIFKNDIKKLNKAGRV